MRRHLRNTVVALLALSGSIWVACERVVEIEEPFPIKPVYCDIDPMLAGRWKSDSVWVITTIDSLDSTIINRRPTFFYDLRVGCTEDTAFQLDYINFSGVVSREVYSTNFATNDTAFLIYEELEEDPGSAIASFTMRATARTDSTFFAEYDQILNSQQQSVIRMWMRKVPSLN